MKRAVRTIVYHIRLSPQENERLRFLAAKRLMTVADYVRWLIAREAK